MNPKVGEAVGRWVVGRREERDWSQDTLHFEARISQSRLSLIEHGKANPKPEEWAVLRGLFGEPPWDEFAAAAGRKLPAMDDTGRYLWPDRENALPKAG